MQDSKQLIQKVAQEIEASSRTSPTAAGPAEQTRAQPTDDHIDSLNEVFTLFRINYHTQYYKAYSDTQVLNQIKKLWLESLTRFEHETIRRGARRVIETSEHIPPTNSRTRDCQVDMDANS